MAINYPSGLDGTAQFGQPSGTSLVTSPDHANLHDNLSSFATAVQNVIGTTQAQNALKNFSASDFAMRINSNGTMSTVPAGGTMNKMVLGTPSIISGTMNNGTFGTPTLQAPTFNGVGTNSGTIKNGVYNSATLGTPTIQGSVIGSANILDGNVVEQKIKMDLLAGTTLTSGTTASQTKVNIVGGSVSIVLPVASNVLISCYMAVSNTGVVPTIVTLLTDGTADAIWNDQGLIAPYSATSGFNAWRTGLAAGTHTWQMQWRTSGVGTLTLAGFELIVQPFSQ